MVSKKRLIDANEPINAFKRYSKNHPNATWNAFGIEEVINAARIVDVVEVVHGRWEEHEPDKYGNMKPKCSICGQYHLAWWADYTHCNYCPNCGAKMDGERRDNND